MTAREWTHADLDRSEWGGGPWVGEPDKIQWVDEATDLDCLMHRNFSGAWCGYVGVPEGHPAFEKHYGDLSLDAHGGLTYSDFCQETTDESRGICHLPGEGRPHRLWWLGFDCHHYMDLAPAYEARAGHRYHDPDAHYWTRPQVEAEVANLAAQLAVSR